MKTNKSKTHWIIDAVLFTGFLLSFLLDLTGPFLHQWLGVGLGALTAYHLVAHWGWVVAVTDRLFTCTSGRARRCYLFDGSLLLGFYLIMLTGLVISTWLALPLSLPEYIGLKNIHVVVSIITLLLIIAKIGLHWRWVLTTARRHILVKTAAGKNRRPGKPMPAPVAAGRRDFLLLMGFVGSAAVAVMGNAMMGISWFSNEETSDQVDIGKMPQTIAIPQSIEFSPAQAQPLPTATLQAFSQPGLSPTGTPTEQLLPTSSLTDTLAPTPEPPAACIVRCSRQCSYPGRCHRYVDANQNSLCDYGECV